MKFNYQNDFVSKYPADSFVVKVNFKTSYITGDTISTCTASAYDDTDTDKTASMISSVVASLPSSASFKLSGGTAGKTYSLKVISVTATSFQYTKYLTCDVYGSVALNSKLADPSANSYVTLTEADEYIRSKRGHSSVWDTLSQEGKKHILIEACKDINRFNFINEPYYSNQALPFPDSTHETLSGDVATPLSTTRIKNTNFSSDSYGSEKYNHNYWQYGTLHITNATPLRDIRNVASSNAVNDIVTLDSALSGTPTVNTDFILFAPLDVNVKYAQIEQALFIVETEGSKSIFRAKAIGIEETQIGDVRIRFQKGASSQKIALSPIAHKLLSRYLRRSYRIGRA
uniref:Putative DnaT-like domain-containing protein n=1 Tax=viral metagenome TaxID=1070528 RepID=A0A6M3JI83_9ZZZZ